MRRAARSRQARALKGGGSGYLVSLVAGETRVFYDIEGETVEILAIVAKRHVQRWLAEQGTPESDGGAGEGEG